MKVSEITIDDLANYVLKYMTSPNEKQSKLSPMESWLGGNFRTSAKKIRETIKNSDAQ